MKLDSVVSSHLSKNKNRGEEAELAGTCLEPLKGTSLWPGHIPFLVSSLWRWKIKESADLSAVLWNECALSAGKEIKFDGLTLSTCHSIINLMDVSFHSSRFTIYKPVSLTQTARRAQHRLRCSLTSLQPAKTRRSHVRMLHFGLT